MCSDSQKKEGILNTFFGVSIQESDIHVVEVLPFSDEISQLFHGDSVGTDTDFAVVLGISILVEN